MRTMAATMGALACAAAWASTPTAHANQAPASSAVICHGQKATIVGTEFRDHLRGTPGPDVIAGLGGNDHISGLGGDDLICAGRFGGSVLRGGRGNDRIYGNRGFNGTALIGGSGNDVLVATTGEAGNFLSGGPGRDHLRAGNGGDLLEGGPDRDVIIGGRSGDRIVGGGGNDLVRGRGSSDEIFGDPGDDQLYAGPGRSDVLNWMHRWRHAYAGTPHHIPITVNLAAGTAYARTWFGHDGVRGFETVWTGDGDDVVTGNAGRNTFYTGAGTDVVRGGPGEDTIRYELVYGSEHFGIRNTYPVRLHIDLAAHRGELWEETTLRGRQVVFGMEDVFGTRFDDVIRGDKQSNRLYGANVGFRHEGDDVIRGRAGRDHLWGRPGDDFLAGGPGDDHVNGQAGLNTIDGGPGTDACTNPATGPQTTRCETVPPG